MGNGCEACDGAGSVPLHRFGCPAAAGGECDCYTTVDVCCPECEGGDAAELTRQVRP